MPHQASWPSENSHLWRQGVGKWVGRDPLSTAIFSCHPSTYPQASAWLTAQLEAIVGTPSLDRCIPQKALVNSSPHPRQPAAPLLCLLAAPCPEI